MADRNRTFEPYKPKPGQTDAIELILPALWESLYLSDFIRCLRVCKQWNYWGQILLNKVVVLDNANLASFIDCAAFRPERFFSIKSLTVRIRIGLPGYDAQLFARAGWRSKEFLLMRLADIMNQYMYGLRAFSFHLEDEPIGLIDFDGITTEPRIGAGALISLLRVIPLGCKSLEFDTAGFEAYFGDDHLCPHVGSLMTTLSHVRLRFGRICPDFINAPPFGSCDNCPGGRQSPVAPNLNSLIVNLELSDVVVGGSTRCSLAQPINSNSSVVENDPTDRLQSEITQALRTGYYNKNCFPNATTIEVFGPVRMEIPPFNYLRHTDILKTRTHILASTNLSAFVDGTWKRGGRRCIRTKDDTDIVGTKSTSRENLEGTWLTATNGARLPKAAKTDKDFLGGTRLAILWDSPAQDTLKQYIKRNTKRYELPLDRIQSELQMINPSENISRTYRTLRPIAQSQFPDPYPMV